MGDVGKGSNEYGIDGVSMGNDVQGSSSDGADLRGGIWVVTDEILKLLEGFHHRVA